MLFRPFAFLLLFALALPAVAAPAYRWTDAQGNVHFGDRPPDEGSVEELAFPQPQAPADPAEDAAARREKQQRLLRAFEAERREREQKAAQARRQVEENEAACKQVRDRLRRFRDSAYLYRLDERGERAPLTEEERAAAEGELEAAIREHCE